jgi:hypothetical protein
MWDMRLYMNTICEHLKIDPSTIPGLGRHPPSQSVSPARSSPHIPIGSLNVSDSCSVGESSSQSSSQQPCRKHGKQLICFDITHSIHQCDFHVQSSYCAKEANQASVVGKVPGNHE